MARLIRWVVALTTFSIASAASAQTADWRCEFARDELATLPSETWATPESDKLADRHYRVWASRECARLRDRRYFNVASDIEALYNRFASEGTGIEDELADRRSACRERAWQRWRKGSDELRRYNSPTALAETCESNAVNVVVQRHLRLSNEQRQRSNDAAQVTYGDEQAQYAAARDRYDQDMARWREAVRRCRAGEWSYCR